VVEGKIVGKIGHGLLALVGVGHDDTDQEADGWLTKPQNCGFFKMTRAK